MKMKAEIKSICSLLALFAMFFGAPVQVLAQDAAAPVAADDGFKLGIERIDGFDDTLDEFGEVSPIDFELGYTLVSAYMWRGQKLGGDASSQFWVSFGPDFEPLGDLNFTIWTNNTKKQEPNPNTEWDWVVDYNVDLHDILEQVGESTDSALLDLNLNIGYIYYRFPPTHTWTQEMYYGLSYPNMLLSPSVTMYNDWILGGGTWWEFAIAHDFDIDIATIATFAKITFNNGQFTGEGGSGFATLDFGASLPIPIGAHMTLEPFLNATIQLNDFRTPAGAKLTEDELYGGLNYTINF